MLAGKVNAKKCPVSQHYTKGWLLCNIYVKTPKMCFCAWGIKRKVSWSHWQLDTKISVRINECHRIFIFTVNIANLLICIRNRFMYSVLTYVLQQLMSRIWWYELSVLNLGRVCLTGLGKLAERSGIFVKQFLFILSWKVSNLTIFFAKIRGMLSDLSFG